MRSAWKPASSRLARLCSRGFHAPRPHPTRSCARQLLPSPHQRRNSGIQRPRFGSTSAMSCQRAQKGGPNPNTHRILNVEPDRSEQECTSSAYPIFEQPSSTSALAAAANSLQRMVTRILPLLPGDRLAPGCRRHGTACTASPLGAVLDASATARARARGACDHPATLPPNHHHRPGPCPRAGRLPPPCCGRAC